MGTWKKLAYEDDVILKSLLTEQGDIIYASGVGTPAALAHGTSSQYLKSGGDAANPSWDTPAGGGPTIVRKTAETQVVNNSIVLVNDDTLSFAVAANEVWEFLLYIKYSSVSGAGWRHAFSVPNGATINTFNLYYTPAVLIDATTVFTSVLGIADRDVWVRYIYKGGVSGGTVQFQWAQKVATVGNTYAQINSYLLAHKIS